jgi:hypothetical protein
VVFSYAQLLAVNHPEVTEVEQILASSEQMDQMTDDILARSRQPKTPEQVDLNRLIQREVASCQQRWVCCVTSPQRCQYEHMDTSTVDSFSFDECAMGLDIPNIASDQ